MYSPTILKATFVCLVLSVVNNSAVFTQCLTSADATCDMTEGQYDNVVIGEVSGDSGQSDGCNDGIVEIVGPPGTTIGCMVVSNSEWAVLIPPNTTIPGNGVYLIACSSDPNSNCGVGINGVSNGLISDDGTGNPEGDFNPGLLGEIDLDVCDSSNSSFYDPAASGFTLDNSNSRDGDQVMLWRPDGTVHDGIYWGTFNGTTKGATTVGGASGNSDHVTVQISGQTYTLGDNDGNGIVNDNPTTVTGGRGDGANATAVPVLPTNDACPCNTAASPGSFTMPALDDASNIWFDMNANSGVYKGCNSSYIRLDSGTSAGGSNNNPSHTDGEIEDAGMNSNGSNMDSGSAPGVTGDFGETDITSEGFTPSSYTPTSCGDPAAQWAYTDHPTPGQPNDDPTFIFYANMDRFCMVGQDVTFTVEVYNYQHVSDATDIMSGVDNNQTGSYVHDPISGMNVPWDTYAVSGETTTMTYTTTLSTLGTFSFGLVWDDFSNCCGTGGLPHSQSSPNECYEIETIEIEVLEQLAYDCDGDGVPDDPQTPCVISCDPAPPAPGTINANDYYTGGGDVQYQLIDLSSTNPTQVNTTGIFSIPLDATANSGYQIDILDIADCGFSILSITINDNCELPPVCPSEVVNTGTTADGPLCPGDEITLCIDGTDLPEGGQIYWYEIATAIDIPDPATDALVGCIDIPSITTSLPSGGPVINEVLESASVNNGSGGEYIEIAGTPGTIMSCYILTDGDSEIVIPSGTVIPADGFLVIASSSNVDGNSADVDVDLDSCNCLSSTNLGLTDSSSSNGEFIALFDASGAIVDGVQWGSPSGGNSYSAHGAESVASSLYTGAGCTAGPTSVTPSGTPLIITGNAVTGVSIERSTDVTGAYQFSDNDTEGNTMGMSNSGTSSPDIPCLTVTVDESYCSGDIFIRPAFIGVPSACLDAEKVGPTSTFSMACPSASIPADAVEACFFDSPFNQIPVTITGGSGSYSITYSLDGAPFTMNGISSPFNILLDSPTDGEVKLKLVSVADSGGSGCIGTVADTEVCVNIRPREVLTITGSSDPTACDPCNGTVTFDLTLDRESNNSYDIEYSFNGVTFSLSGVSMPFTIPNACPGTYNIISAADDFGCLMDVELNEQILDAPSGPPLSVTTQPAAICGTNGSMVDLAGVTFNETYISADFDFFSVDPNTLPSSVLGSTPPMLASTTVSPTANTTYWVRYTDPISKCESFATIEVTIDNTICFDCPALTTLTDPTDICVGGNFDLSVTGLNATHMNQTSGGGAFGIQFKAFSGVTAPADAYVATGMSLGTVLNPALTNSDTEATVTDVGGSLLAGDYQICAILTETPTEAMCRPQVCVSVTVNPPSSSTNATLAVCDDNTDGLAVFTLTDADMTVLNGQTGMTVTYHATQVDAQMDENALPASYSNTTAMSQIIYARVENSSTGCYSTSELTLIVEALPPCIISGSVIVCEGDAINLTETDTGRSGGQWDWNGPNGFTSSLSAGWISIPNTTSLNSGIYSVTVTDFYDSVSSCQSTCSVDVSVVVLPSVSVGTLNDICIGDADINITGSPVPGTGEMGTFSSGTGVLTNVNSSTGTATINASTLTVGTYAVTYTYENTNGCQDENVGQLLVHSIPTLSATSNNPITCGGSDGSIVLTLTNVADGTYTIDYMDATPAAQTFTGVMVSGGSATISGLSQGTYNDLSITINGCTSTADVDFTLSDPGAPDAPTTSPLAFCVGDIASELAATGTGTLNWYTVATGGTALGSAPTPLTAMEGVTTYYVSQTVAGCESNRTSLVVTVNAVPTLSATATNPMTCGGDEGRITLMLGSVPDGMYTINYMDATPAAQTFTNVMVSIGSATITGLSQGTYNDLSITINGCTSTTDVDFTLLDPVTPNAPTTSPLTFCVDDVASALTATGTGTLSWYSVAVGGTAIPTPTPSTISAGVTTYYVSQTVNGCESERASLVVTVNAGPSVNTDAFIQACEVPFESFMGDFDLSDAEDLANNDVDGDGMDGSTATVTYYSDPDGLNPINNGMDLPPADIYAKVESANGCSEIVLVKVELFRVADFTVSPTASTTCNPDNGIITFSGLAGSAGFALEYVDPSGTTVNTTISTNASGITQLTGLAPGIYNMVIVSVQPISGLTCPGPSFDVTIDAPDIPDAPTTSPVSYCVGDVATELTATGTGALNWYTVPTGGTALASAPTPSTTSAGITTYYVSQTIAGCESARASLSVAVFDVPKLSAVGINPSNCGATNGRIELTQMNVPDGTYTINYEDASGMGQTFTGVMITGGMATINGLSAGMYNNLSIMIHDCVSVEDVDIQLTQVCDMDVALQKMVSSAGPYKVGDKVNYTIVVHNQGTEPIYHVTVVDYLPSELDFFITDNSTNDFSTSSDTGGGGTITTTVATTTPIAGGAGYTINLVLTVNSSAAPDSTIQNDAEVTNATMDAAGMIPIVDEDDDLSLTGGGTEDDNNIDDNAMDDPNDQDDFDFARIRVCGPNCGTFPWDGSK